MMGPIYLIRRVLAKPLQSKIKCMVDQDNRTGMRATKDKNLVKTSNSWAFLMLQDGGNQWKLVPKLGLGPREKALGRG
ncbi:hypothetical protein BH20ACI3_BH20ACI3_28570 [soil metagenome]